MAHNSDSDSGDERLGAENGPRRQRPAGLQNIWQLLVGQAHFEARGPPANSNAELVAELWRSGTIKSITVKRAMLACPRHVFMPPDLQDEAYIDAPVRVHEHGFNISAPHIHAAALEALDLVEGDRFLDVGCGCGMPSAAAAQLVGPSGSVTSLDIRQAALDMSQRAVAQITETDPDYAASSCTITWEKHNIFFPTARHIGKYSKVYIGAACPRDRLREVLKLLSPEGGLLLVPVESELLLFKKLPNGKIGKRVMSAVRFSELEVPRDVDVVMACLSEDRRAARTLAHPASTYKADMEAILNPARNGSGSSGKTSNGDKRGGSGNLISGLLCGWTSTHSQDGAAAEPAGPDTPAGHGMHDQDWTMVENGVPKRHKSGVTRQPSYLTSELLSRLGPPDCYLHGSSAPLRPGEKRPLSRPSSRPASPAPILTPDTSAGGGGGRGGDVTGMEGVEGVTWRLPAHRAVLQARCEHLRALFTSGMRDAEEGALAAPEGVSVSAVRCLMHHVYEDTGVEALPLEQVSEVLHVAAYFGCSHLTSLCEQRLAAVLITPDADGSADDMAAQLLALADEVALPQLRQLALSYIVEHYEEVSRSDSYKELPRALVDAVVGAACKETCKVMSILQELSGKARPGKDGDRDSDEDIL